MSACKQGACYRKPLAMSLLNDNGGIHPIQIRSKNFHRLCLLRASVGRVRCAVRHGGHFDISCPAIVLKYFQGNTRCRLKCTSRNRCTKDTSSETRFKLAVLLNDVSIDTFWTNVSKMCPKCDQKVAKIWTLVQSVTKMCP